MRVRECVCVCVCVRTCLCRMRLDGGRCVNLFHARCHPSSGTNLTQHPLPAAWTNLSETQAKANVFSPFGPELGQKTLVVVSVFGCGVLLQGCCFKAGLEKPNKVFAFSVFV